MSEKQSIELNTTDLESELSYVRGQKEIAIDNQDFVKAGEWRDKEKQIMYTLATLARQNT